MAFRPEMDATELRDLYIDMSGAPNRVQRGATQQLRKGADLVARSMRKEVAGHRYLRHLPHTVSHEMIDDYTAEIGMETKRKQGRLAHIMAYGSVNNEPVFDHTLALRKREPEIVRSFEDMGENAVLGEATK